MSLGSAVSDLRQLLQLPAVTIEMSGDAECRELYAAFTRRHPRLRVIRSKRWGVALLPVPDRFEDYLQQPDRSHLRKQLKHARKAAFTFCTIDPFAHIDEILAINRSAEQRQGQPMHPAYLDEETVRRYFEHAADVFGVVDSEGVLRAYVCMRTCGDVTCVERLLGHADALRHGVMWVLLAGTIEVMSKRRQETGRPVWFMYDTFFGATPGMRQFKAWIGCQPYRVSWMWRA